MQEYRLLTEYKKYDYLNLCRECPLIKILVSYIKPSFLFKSEILTPIHLGRAIEKDSSKDGGISDEDVNWLHENCIGDDDFEGNISHVNRRVGFFTGTYWAKKNYEKLGNPEYFGSFGYRKLFLPAFLNNLHSFDAFLPKMEENPNNWTNKERYVIARGEKVTNITREFMKELYPKDLGLYDDYFNLKVGFYHELYVFKKEVFFEFCDWIFPFVFKLLKYSHEDFLPQNTDKITPHSLAYFNENRDIAFVMERLTGFYCYKITQQKDKKCLNVPMIYLGENLEKFKSKQKLLSLLKERIQKREADESTEIKI